MEAIKRVIMKPEVDARLATLLWLTQVVMIILCKLIVKTLNVTV